MAAFKRIFDPTRLPAVRKEFLAGATTFATMSYIIGVQPALMATVGMDFGAVMAATCVASAIGTLLMGALANYPIALAPAMGHNFYFAFGVCAALGVTWQVALGANFIAGAIFVVLSAIGLRERLIDAVPQTLKDAIASGIGLLIAFVGLKWGGIVVGKEGTLVALGDLTSPATRTALGGILILAILYARGVRGAIILAMLATTLLGISQGLIELRGFVARPPSLSPTFLELDIAGALRPEMLEVVFVLFFLALFDTIGTLIGVAGQAGLLVAGKLPRARRALLADSLSIVQGTLWGTSTITSYVESAAGVAEGARTGLANVATALLFLCALFFFPLVQTIAAKVVVDGRELYPAISAPLVLVGALMLRPAARIPWRDPEEAVPAFLCMVIMPFSLSIADGIGFGMVSYCLVKAAMGRAKEIDWLLLLFALLFACRYILA